MNGSTLRIVVGVIAVLLLTVLAAGGFCWWKIAGLKEELVHDLGKAIGAEVQITSLDFDFWKGELRAAGITLSNNRPSAPWEKGEIAQAVVRFHLGDIFKPSLPLTLEVTSWNVVLRPPGAEEPAPTSSLTLAPEPVTTASRVTVTQISAQDGSVDIHLSPSRQIEVRGVSFASSANGTEAWTTELRATSVTSGTLEATASSVQIRSEPDKITFSNLRMTCGQGGLTGGGDVALGATHAAHFSLKATDIPVTMLVSVQWQMKLAGLVSGDLTYAGTDQSASAQGAIAMSHAKFNVLPWLAQVTSLVGLPDMTNVEVDKATTDFTWQDGTIHLSNLDIRKTDVMRIGGTVDVAANTQIDGKLKLGLPTAIAAKWPKLQEKVFSTTADDYAWTDVHVTGTPDHLQEDLSSRLVSVGMEQGGSLIDQATKKATDLFHSLMGK